MVEAFRGVGKSWVTAALVAWLLYDDPQRNILVVSASKVRADNFTTFVRILIDQIPELQHLRPRLNQRDSKLSFDVGPAEPDQSPSVMSAGITGQITGMRADVIIADDIEVPNNSATQTMRETLANAIKEFDAILKPDGTVIYLGTPQTESSIYNLLPSRGYTIRVWPARYPTEQQRTNYGDRLAPLIAKAVAEAPSRVGRTTEPSRFTDLDLMEREASYGKSGFALQFMLDTRLSDSDRHPLKLKDLVVMPLDLEQGPEKVIWSGMVDYIHKDLPNVGLTGDRLYRPANVGDQMRYSRYTGKVMAIDPAGKGKDETAWAVVYILNSQLFLVDAGAFQPGQGSSEETLKSLAEIAGKYKVNQIIVEANFGDGMFTQLLKPWLAKTHPCGVEDVKHNTQKERRICDTLEPVMNSHRLIVNSKLFTDDLNSTEKYPSDNANHYQLFYQMTRITRDKGALAHDDRLDAVAMAVAHWTRHLAADVDKQVDVGRARQLDAELRRFMHHALGRRPAERVWASRN